MPYASIRLDITHYVPYFYIQFCTVFLAEQMHYLCHCPRMAIFPPANSGTSGSNYNPRNTSMYGCLSRCI